MGRIKFFSDWTHKQDSDIRSDEPLFIEYARSRLSRDRGYYSVGYSGRPSWWDITAHIRFHPGGQERSVSVDYGSATVEVPIDAKKIEIWFENTGRGDTWDSRYGENYWFDVI